MDTTTSIEDKIKPRIAMDFDSLDKLVEYYKFYGKEKGFEIRKRTSSKGDDREVKYITLACPRNNKSNKMYIKKCFKIGSSDKNSRAPVARIIDQDKAIQNAIEIIFQMHAIGGVYGISINMRLLTLVDYLSLEVVDLASDSDDKCNMVMKVIHNLKMKLILYEGINMHAQTISGKENNVSNKNGKVNRTLNFGAYETFSDGANEFYGFLLKFIAKILE
ncbi:hypothetical protein FEM48_Zijuj05G0112100 [Ziziphus jujuba var. spinosa]|uniref:Protein FAR1-RELATED SEQUENCE n=1 Tax=Ziziphus jujuba var. spinosa TaxID=714518 RepID=A0A978VEM3_ZIZJJ|nr:hypothetical protein FEM48_Zijuj05G0112100 [Ziziphus jujuba var. spinosa]